MRAVLMSIGVALAVAGCQMQGEEDQIENALRENLKAQGNVQEIELRKQDDTHYTGHAVLRDPQGRERRLNCAAEITGTGANRNFNANCAQIIDETTLAEMENIIRADLSQRANVVEIDMQKRDDNNMIGFARLTDQYGNEVRTECTATRPNAQTTNFQYNCAPSEQGGGGDGGKPN